MRSLNESLIYHSVDAFGVLVRVLPLPVALFIGRLIGRLAYYFDTRHKALAYANLKKAFADSKSPAQIKQITKDLFQNYGQNLIDLLRIPLINPQRFKDTINVEGVDHLSQCLKQGKGAIMLAMHFGSWELASLSCAMLRLPYKVIVNPQARYSYLDELLNSYRSCGGYVVLSKGMGTRDVVRSLANNEVIGMVVDQGGRDGIRVPFFGRTASMAVGALRMGLKWGVPICFSVIHRQANGRHRMIVHPPLELVNTGRMQEDIKANLSKITLIMEDYIQRYPAEYMWFYKIWKYSDQASIVILDDGRIGHLRQSESVARMLQKALLERNIRSSVCTVSIKFKSPHHRHIFEILVWSFLPWFYQGHVEWLQWFLTADSYKLVRPMAADFIVSCGSSVAALNHFLAKDQRAKSVTILKPAFFGYQRFDLVILPRHDAMPSHSNARAHLAYTQGAPNIIIPEYLEEQSQALLNRYSHLKDNHKLKIGIFVGGDSKNIFLSEHQMKILIDQVSGVAQEINADLLVTTSRRTPPAVEQLIQRRLRKHPRCALLVLASENQIPEVMGGILGLSDINVVSGDSISMVSESASSGKNTIVFMPQIKDKWTGKFNKHLAFIEQLSAQGHILVSGVVDVGRVVYDIAKGKIQTKRLDDNPVILEAVRKII